MDGKQAGGPVVDGVESQIEKWRAHLRRSQAISGSDASELEDHLREQIASLTDQGLSGDEAFLVAVKRMGAIDTLTREFAREHSERLWKQLVLPGDGWDGASAAGPAYGSRRMWVALAAGAAAAVKLPSLFGISLSERMAPAHQAFYAHNIPFFVLPFLVAYFAWERPLARASRLFLAAVFLLAALVVNLLPFPLPPGADTETLMMIHLPIVLWLAVGTAYVGGRWRGSERRMDFVRFTGELFIYMVLIALGGGVLIGMTFALFRAIGIDMEPYVGSWIAPCGAAGALLVATWLVEAKQSVIENIAPVLTRIFAPLFALLLLAFLGTMLFTGRGIDVEREILIMFDLLLVVVFGLLLYSFSARDPLARPSLLDVIQVVLVGLALVVDALALWAIGSRITEFGTTPNRLAALGLNVVLLVNLAGTAALYARFLRRRVAFVRLLEWQTVYLYVIAAWAAVVAFLFPPLFGFR